MSISAPKDPGNQTYDWLRFSSKVQCEACPETEGRKGSPHHLLNQIVIALSQSISEVKSGFKPGTRFTVIV